MSLKPRRPSTVSMALERLEDRTLLDAGFLDPTFGSGGRVLTDFGGSRDEADAVVAQADGKIIVAGSTFNGEASDFALARYLPDGTLDAGFGTAGRVTTAFGSWSHTYDVVVQPDGKIVAAGGGGFKLVRYNPDGTIDDSFGTGGKVSIAFDGLDGASGRAQSLALQPDGKLVVAGTCATNNLLARLNPDGTLDAGFGTAGKVGFFCDFATRAFHGPIRVAVQPDGKIVTAVSVSSGWATSNFIGLSRYNADGTPDAEFKRCAFLEAARPGLRLQSDGKILLAGLPESTDPVPPRFDSRFAVNRCGPDGSPDPSFGSAGEVVVELGSRVSDSEVLVQADGSIVVVGPVFSDPSPGYLGMTVTRLLSNGAVNTSFGVAGVVRVDIPSAEDPATQAALLPDGKLVVVGTVPGAGTGYDFHVMRFNLADTFTTDNQDYVGQLYLTLLGRPAEQAGLNAFVSLLDQRRATRDQVAQVVMGSEEYRTVTVQNLYWSLLGRAADAAGLAAFLGFLGTGGTVAQAKAAFLGSDEYFQKHGGTNAGFLNALYRQVLGRWPDGNGQQVFLPRLDTGTLRGTVAAAILGSREGHEWVVQGWYRSYLRRAADSGGRTGYADFLQAGSREEVAQASILSSAEFAAGL